MRLLRFLERKTAIAKNGLSGIFKDSMKFRTFRHYLLAALALVMIAFALQAADFPSAPPAYLLDDTHLFTEEQQAKLKSSLTEIAQKTGVKLYVTAFTFVREGTITDTVSSLSAKWLKGEPGLVMAYNRGNGLCVIGCSPAFWNRYPTTEVMMVLANVSSNLAVITVPADERMITAVNDCSTNLLQMETNRVLRAQLFSAEDKRLALGFGIVLFLLSASIWIIRRKMKRQQIVRDVSHFFPEDFEVAPRLGATLGGGVMAQARRNQ